MRLLLARCCAFVVAALPVMANACSESAARDLARGFYEVKGHPSIVPEHNELAASSRPFSGRLHRLLVEAARYRDEFIETHPPESLGPGVPQVIYKPPFVDGDIFTGSPDGAS